MKISFVVIIALASNVVSSRLQYGWNYYNPHHQNYYFYSGPVQPQKLATAFDDLSCRKALRDTTQLLDETVVTLESVQSELNILSATSQHLARTMVTVWVMTTARMEEASRRSDAISNQMGEMNDTVVNLKKELADTQKDFAVMKALVAELATDFKASTSSASIGKMPNSCGDLQLIGHKISGLYSVMGKKSVESVYCDFTKDSNDTDYQKFIGYAGVKSAPTYFYVQKNNSFSTIDVAIPFEIERLNIGGAMDVTNGTFTAPKSGTYYFSFSGLAEFPASNEFEYLEIRLYLNGNRIGTGHTSKASASDYQFSQLALQSTLNLREGDQIWLQITGMSDGVFLFDASDVHHTHFSGFLLEEDL